MGQGFAFGVDGERRKRTDAEKYHEISVSFTFREESVVKTEVTAIIT